MSKAGQRDRVNRMSLLNGQQLMHSGHLLLCENVVPDLPDLLIFFFLIWNFRFPFFVISSNF